MKLFKPIYYIDNPKKTDKAIAALSEVESADMLFEIYRNAPLDAVAYAALDQIKNQRVLSEFLNRTTRNIGDREKIFERITDVTILKDFIEHQVAIGSRFWNEKLVMAALNKLPKPDPEILKKFLTGLEWGKDIEWVENLKYPENRDLLITIMNLKVRYPVTKAAAKKISVDKETELIRDVIDTVGDGAADVFFDCFKMPEDKEIFMKMLRRGKELRIKAANMLAQDETMLDYKICPYCGRPGSAIGYGYTGCYNDMFYYGWYCPCGHKKTVPEGYGKPDSFEVTIAEFIKNPEECMK